MEFKKSFPEKRRELLMLDDDDVGSAEADPSLRNKGFFLTPSFPLNLC